MGEHHQAYKPRLRPAKKDDIRELDLKTAACTVIKQAAIDFKNELHELQEASVQEIKAKLKTVYDADLQSAYELLKKK